MTEILSKPLKDEIIKLIKKTLRDENNKPDEVYESLENDIEEVSEEVGKLKVLLKDENLKELIAKVMIELMPEFNEKISTEVSKEMKAHFVTIAEFVIKLFKEKE